MTPDRWPDPRERGCWRFPYHVTSNPSAAPT